MSGFGDGGEKEESLSTGMQQHIDRFRDIQIALGDLGAQASLLKTRCDTLKSQRENLQAGITSLTSDRDALRLEYKSEAELNEWYLKRDLTASNSDSSAVNGIGIGVTHGGFASRDERGKLVRRAHLFETRCKELERDLAAEREGRYGEIEAERAVASGLRERIGKLEGKVRDREADLEAMRETEQESRKHVKKERDDAVEEERRLRVDLEDVKAALSEQRKRAKELDEEVRRLREEKQAAEEALRRSRAQDAVKSPPNILRSYSPNIPIPMTPTKSRHHPPFSSSGLSPSRRTPTKPVTSPTTSLANRFAHLEDLYKTLRTEYYDMRAKYGADKQYWKEYRAVEKAREERKRARKEEKARARKVQEQADLTNVDRDSLPAKGQVEGYDGGAGAGASRNILVGESAARPLGIVSSGARPLKTDATEQHSSQQNPMSQTVDENLSEEEQDYESPEEPARAIRLPSPRPIRSITQSQCPSSVGVDPARRGGAGVQSRRTTPDAHCLGMEHDHNAALPAVGPRQTRSATPDGLGGRVHATPAIERRAPALPSRTTPWLGAIAKPKRTPTTRIQPYDPFEADDLDADLGAPLHRTRSASTFGASRTPLVRDRGLGDASLRRTALQRNLAAVTPVTVAHSTTTSTPIREVLRSQSPAVVSEQKKRKLVDMEGLSPAEKARQLKKLNRLPASEKRVVYAEYKGKGRYLAPEEVKAAVHDEFEIDPEQNEGANFAFHDVKRRKEERRQMHGGDCECCKGYYEAVGHIPRFNEGPRWRDAGEEGGDGDDGDEDERAVQEHQNRVSRHRDTWARAPTPPGYWAIGFPTTQDVHAQNQVADRMVADKEAKIRREAAQRDGKWRKKV